MLEKIKVDDFIHFVEEKQKYRVRARGSRFIICNKPFNLKRTTLYTIIDLHEQIRGAENLVFGLGAETQKECEEMLLRLEKGDSEISYRNRVPLKILKYHFKNP